MQEVEEDIEFFYEYEIFNFWISLTVYALMLLIVTTFGIVQQYKRRLRIFEANILVLMFAAFVIGIVSKIYDRVRSENMSGNWHPDQTRVVLQSLEIFCDSFKSWLFAS